MKYAFIGVRYHKIGKCSKAYTSNHVTLLTRSLDMTEAVMQTLGILGVF